MSELTPEPEDRETPTTVEGLSVVMDRRFDQVQTAIVEQRQYTEFAFGKLEGEMVGVKSHLVQLEGKLDQEMVGVKSELGRLGQDMTVVKSGLGRLERKLDQVIDRLPSAERSEPPSPEE